MAPVTIYDVAVFTLAPVALFMCAGSDLTERLTSFVAINAYVQYGQCQ